MSLRRAACRRPAASCSPPSTTRKAPSLTVTTTSSTSISARDPSSPSAAISAAPDEGAGASARSSGRGTASDPDVIQARSYEPPEKPVKRTPHDQELYVPEDLPDFARFAIPPKDQQPRVVLRFASEKDLVLSGMITGGNEIAEKPAVVDDPHGKGHVVLFANNPMWRGETMGSYFLVFNAILNFDHLDAGSVVKSGATSASVIDPRYALK